MPRLLSQSNGDSAATKSRSIMTRVDVIIAGFYVVVLKSYEVSERFRKKGQSFGVPWFSAQR